VISPDVDDAVVLLGRDGVIAAEQATLFGRIARGELVSVARALQVLLYLGVLGVTTGTGLLFQEQIAHLGPLTITLAVGFVAVACLGWVLRTSPPFSTEAVASPHFSFDYILGLGALLFAADLAFVEAQFSPLGDNWVFHLLVVSIFYAALAFRFDSRSLFALSLTTFAAWRGVAATSAERALFGFFDESDAVRLNALACGMAFVLLGRALDRKQLKAHFEPTAAHLGWFLILQAIAWGIGDSGKAGLLHRVVLIAVGCALAWFSWRGARFGLFVFGVLAAYLGAFVVLADVVEDGTLLLFLIGVSAIGLVFGLAAVHRRFPKEGAE
jgi:hypothetical protein